MGITGIVSNQSSSDGYQSPIQSQTEETSKSLRLSFLTGNVWEKKAKHKQNANFKSITYLKDKHNEGNFEEYIKENCVARLGLHLGIHGFSVTQAHL